MTDETPATPEDGTPATGGFPSPYDHAVKTVETWMGARPDHGQPVTARLTLADAADHARTFELDEATLQALAWMFQRDGHQRKMLAGSEKRCDAMADLLVKARRQYPEADIGDVLARALALAADKLYQPWYLVVGRPGSWEAAIVMSLAREGKTVVIADEGLQQLVGELAELFQKMGEAINQKAPEDGGDTVSLALGQAVTEIGSMAEFLGNTAYGEMLRNLSGQYAQVPDGWNS